MILLMNMPGNRCLSSKDTRGHLYFDIVKNTKKTSKSPSIEYIV